MSRADEPAFPTIGTYDHNGVGVVEPVYGLTKRELFAAMAMQGVLAADVGGNFTTDEVAYKATDAADALIAALKREPGE